jgi:signal transduction histidine kinase/CheY-like chemotaxis protein
VTEITPQGEPLGSYYDPANASAGQNDLVFALQKQLLLRLPMLVFINDVANERVLFSSNMETTLGIPDDPSARTTAFLSCIPDDHRDRVHRLCDEAAVKGEDIVIEFPFIRPDNGRRIIIREHLITFLDKNGKPSLQQGFMIDVTDQRQLEERMREMERMEALGRMAGGIVHDFNTVLAIVSGFVEGLDESKDAETQKTVAGIKEAIDRGSRMTEQLLTFTRRQVATAATCCIDEVMEESHGFFESAVRGKKRKYPISLEIEFNCTRPACVPVSDAQMMRVLVNLMVNAREAIPDERPGKVRIRCTDAILGDGRAAVSVIVDDNGTGVQEEMRPHLFEPFFTTKEAGSGLGLATVWGVINGAGGSVAIGSNDLGGCSMQFILPRIEVPKAEPLRPANEPTAAGMPVVLQRPASSEGCAERLVLVVDDEPSLRMLIGGYLKAHGWKSVEAGSGEEAIALIEDGLRPCCAVSDVVMPGMSGVTLVRALRQRLPDLGVLVISAYPDSDGLRELMAEPKVAFLEKPFAAARLVGALDALDAKDGGLRTSRSGL